MGKENNVIGMYESARRRVDHTQKSNDAERQSFIEAVSAAMQNALRSGFGAVSAKLKEKGARTIVAENVAVTVNDTQSRHSTVAGEAKALISIRFQLPPGWATKDGYGLSFLPDIGVVASQSRQLLVMYATDVNGIDTPPNEVGSFDPMQITEAEVKEAVFGAIDGMIRSGQSKA